MNVDEAKEYVLTTLLRPLEELAHLFQGEFCNFGYYNDLVLFDWSRSTIGIDFRKNPTSDMIREIVFNLYKRQWGGKPDGLEIAYKASVPTNHSWHDISPPDVNPIRLLITMKDNLKDVFRGNEKVHVLDDTDYRDWEARKAHDIIKRATRVTHVIKTPDRPALDPGQAVPMFHVGLYKV